MIKACSVAPPTRSGVKRNDGQDRFQKKNMKTQLVVNRGRVRHVTFGTGAKVVESAGVVRVKVSYKMIPQVISQ